MKECEAYLDVAERFIDSCEQHIANNINIQEVLGFKAYHAFESIGGAYNSHFGYNVPKSHVRKINTFVTNSRHRHGLNPHAIAALAIVLSSVRNKYLYPEYVGSDYKTPKEQVSLTDARTTVNRVRGVVRGVSRLI